MKYRRLVSLLFVSLMVSTVILSLPFSTFAMTKGERNAIIKNIPFYNPDANNCGPSDLTAAPAEGVGSGKVYMLGDSITEGTAAELATAFNDKGFSGSAIDGKSSRRLSEGGTNLDGITVLQDSVASFKDAGTIVIALGTNGTINTANIDKTMAIIKQEAGTAKVFWVNIGVDNSKRSGVPIDNESMNTILQENTSKGYSTIDWASKVKENGDYIDPNPGTGLGVHPAGAGKQAFAETVASGATSVASNAAINTPEGGSACCSAKAATGETSIDAGDGSTEENARIIFQYFVGKGLTDFQAAGILGNIEHESGFEPRLVQYGHLNSRGEISEPGKPSRLDDMTPPGALTGYGIVQFTPATKILPAAQAAGKSPGDIIFQLDFVWEQFQGSEGVAFKALQDATNIEEATIAFEVKYERHAGPPQPKRIVASQKWFDLLKGTVGSSFTSGSCSSKLATTGGDFTGYFQMDPEWKNIPYASGTVGSSGCGATSLATIISNLNADKNITPATIVNDIAEAGLQPTTISLRPFSAIPVKYGLTMTNYNVSQFTEALDVVTNSNGNALMIANVRPGYWTSVGHYFVIRGVGPDGKVQVHDVGETTASHPKTDKTYDPSFFTSAETSPINFMVISK